jgi:TonB family protein
MAKWMVMRIQALLMVGMCAMPVCWGQTVLTPQSIKAQLQGPILMLRGMYGGRTLKFDAEGNLVGRAETMPFSMSAVRLDKVKVRDTEVVIGGQREGLEFSYSQSGDKRWVREQSWGAEVRIEIARDPAHPEELNSALARVFSVGLDKELAEEVPAYWRPWLLNQLDPSVKVEATAANAIDLSYDWEKPKLKDMTGPRLDPSILTMPEEPVIAQQAGYGGTPLLAFVVDTNGKPTEIRIVRPVGMGLDEEAVKVASQLRFKPAQYKGKPVAVLIDFGVPFLSHFDWGSQFDRGPTTSPQ